MHGKDGQLNTTRRPILKVQKSSRPENIYKTKKKLNVNYTPTNNVILFTFNLQFKTR